jgi:hypothetical protein
MIRHVHRREVDLSSSLSWDVDPEPFDLRWAAWAAAVETLQIDIVASGWMNLFAALLVPSPTTELRWAGGGPGTNAEIKRAYSALMGRFFGRATLRRDHGCRWLRQVVDGLELAPGVHLRRRTGQVGDLPDWVGWDDFHCCWVVAEAKGSHDRSNWIDGNPPPLRTALLQLDRVEIVDASGPIAFKTWAVACRWGTELNGLAPVIITCDPDGRGRQLEEWEVAKHREEARARWVADLLDGLGRPEIATAARYGDIAPSIATEVDLVLVPGRSGYAALAIETGGIIPLVGPGRAGRAASIIETAQLLKRATALVLLDRGTVESAVLRVGPADILDDGSVQRWWSRTSETKLAVPDRPELNVDGVTFRTMVDDIQFPNAATLP